MSENYTEFSYTLSGKISAPAGSKLNPSRTGIVLPNGKTLKIWEALELQDDTDDEPVDLTYDQATDMGIHYDGDPCRFDEK